MALFGSGRRIAQLEDAVNAQRAVIAELAGRLGIDPDRVDPMALDDEERRLVDLGKPIAATKHHRERTGSSLLLAKQAVDRAAGR